MQEIIFTKVLTAAQVNALDGTAVTLATFTGEGMYLPRWVRIRKEAGTRYTITPTPVGSSATDFTAGGTNITARGAADVARALLKASFDEEGRLFDVPRGTVDVDKSLIIYDTFEDVVPNDASEVNQSRGELLFRIPLFEILQSPNAVTRLITPVRPTVVRPGTNRIKVESLAGIANGTGTVQFDLCFEYVA